ncbi:MAG: UDP-N-acetylglucosamine 2-epimerase [Dysgonamonadaceae bacterium]
MKMKICIPTATRAEYGLLKPLMEKVAADPELTLQLLVTGAHLSPSHGMTKQQITRDGFTIDAEIDMQLTNDNAQAILRSMGLEMLGLSDQLTRLSPDLIVLLGDRYEMLIIAVASLISRIPIIHIHGGELTEGAIDDSIRHAITKMSALHFTSTEVYRTRVIQLGEQPNHVFNVGAPGLDNIKTLDKLTRPQLELALGIQFQRYNYLITYNPETTSDRTQTDFSNVLDALRQEKESLFIFTKSNADEGGQVLNLMIQRFVEEFPGRAFLFDSLGTQRYLSLMIESTAVVGNSSSGILEAPAAHTATINIGDRQKGRIQATSIINCRPKTEEVLSALKKVKQPLFRKKLADLENPYGNGTASEQMYQIIKQVNPKELIKKSFYDL